jgi:MerR family transcriptional regulator, light-induced transcriptional regulator
VTSGSTAFMDDLVGPLLRTIGQLWERGRIDPYHERLVTGVVQQTIARHVLWQSTGESAPRAVVCTPSGQRHDIGAILAACALSAEGWQVINLGADVPARDIARAAEQTGARIVALSIIHPSDDPKLIAELSTLRDRLPGGVKIVVGGDAAGSYARILRKIGAEVEQDVRGLSNICSSTPANAPARSPQGDGNRSDRSGAGS